MNCPKCKSNQVFVIDSRNKEWTVFRRRECKECGYRYNTVEIEADLYEQFRSEEIQNDIKKVCTVLLDAHELASKVCNAWGVK